MLVMLLFELEMCMSHIETTSCHRILQQDQPHCCCSQLLISTDTPSLIENYTQSSSLLLPPYVVMLCTACAPSGGPLLLLFRPLPLQLPEHIRSQQPVSHEPTSQRTVHRLVRASLFPLTTAAGQTITAGSFAIPMRCLRGVSDARVGRSDESGNI